MALRIRLKRFGAKKQPSYRLVVADSRAARDGRFVETVGYYNPLTEPATIQVDAERARQWLQRGAQPSDSVRHVLITAGLWEQITGKPAPASQNAPAAVAAAGAADQPPAPAGDQAQPTPAAPES